MLDLQKEFVKNIRQTFRGKGENWLKNLPSLLKECEERYEIKILPPFELSFNYVAPALKVTGEEVVIKLSIPHDDFTKELETIKRFSGKGMVRLLDYDVEAGIQILERVKPGKMLATLTDDEEATRVAANVMRDLYVPAPKGINLPHIRDRKNSLNKIRKENPNGIGPIPAERLKEADDLMEKMMNSLSTDLYLLHGDFHHYNILSNGNDSWIAIDPKGLVGEVEYDFIQFLLNKLPDTNVKEILEKRIDILVGELNLNKTRLLQWAFCHAVLSTSWSVGDDGSYSESFFQTIEIFRDNLIGNGWMY